MRLVSACYNSFYPLTQIKKFTSTEVSVSPNDLQKGDGLLVWGGEDIHPSFYGRSRSKQSGASPQPSRRDIIEWEMMKRANELELPIIGICRGAQMLCALAGGSLFQHVSGHTMSHNVHTMDGHTFKVNSLHHQMMNPTNTEHNVVAWSEYLLSEYYYDEDKDIKNIDIEPEFIYFPTIKGFAIQWHPEMMAEDAIGTMYINNYITERL